jgi:S-adenosylmethionine:tRNA ribosyltransferase-isomerase
VGNCYTGFSGMKTSDFDYQLHPGLIAQTPLEPRDHSRLMVLRRDDGSIEHRRFFEIVDYLSAGDILVFNDSRVIPARLRGKKPDSGGRVELLLLHRLDEARWEALVKPAKRVNIGARVEIEGENSAPVLAEVIGVGEDGTRIISFSDEAPLAQLGRVPLPPYIKSPLADPERYQTVYSRVPGSAAAPTAGLHFTPELLNKIERSGVCLLFTTLHVGLDTFRPVKEDDPLKHPIHKEYGSLSPEVAAELSRAKTEGRRVICVGTTTVRLVEAAARGGDLTKIQSFEGWVDLFILPGYKFRMVDGVITNFHLPRSTVLMLVCAFAGRDFIDKAYREAVSQQYRFYSFGDAMLAL